MERYISYDRVERQQQHFGYLTVDEVGYVLAKRDLLFGQDSLRYLRPGLPMEGYLAGRKRLEEELKERPLIPRGIPERFNHWILCKLRSNEPEPTPIVFACSCCSQSLRIPGTRKRLTVHCPTCDSKLDCYS